MTAAIVALWAIATAAAPEPEAHEEHTDNAVSVRALLGRAAAASDPFPLVGFGVAYERDVLHGLLAVEVAADWLAEPKGNALMLELLLEKPIPVTADGTLYIGGGPAIVEHLRTGRFARLGVGALMLVGVEAVVVDQWELFVELDTAFFYTDAPVVETDLGVGVMWRF